jgi:hypothetical protein
MDPAPAGLQLRGSHRRYGRANTTRRVHAGVDIDGLDSCPVSRGCLHFQMQPDFALDVVESTVARLPVSAYAAGYQAMRDAMRDMPTAAQPLRPR